MTSTKQLTAAQYLSWVMVRDDLCHNNPWAQAVITEALDRGVSPQGPALSVALRDGRMRDAEYRFCNARGVDPLAYVKARKHTGLSFAEILGMTFDVHPEDIKLETSGRMPGVNTAGNPGNWEGLK